MLPDVDRQSNASPSWIPKLEDDDRISVDYLYIIPSYHQQAAQWGHIPDYST